MLAIAYGILGVCEHVYMCICTCIHAVYTYEEVCIHEKIGN